MTDKQIEKAYDKLRQQILDEIILEARKAMKKRPSLTEFFMCMGSIFFSQGDDDYTIHPSEVPCAKRLTRLLDNYNNDFNFHGDGIRFTATGPIVTNW